MRKRAATNAPSPSAKRHETADTELGDNDDEHGFKTLDSFDKDNNNNSKQQQQQRQQQPAHLLGGGQGR